jgi:hypothetical protein
LFDDLETLARNYHRDIVIRVGDFAVEKIQQNLDSNVKNPTPYYETQIIHEEVRDGQRLVHDRGIVYGPWLEGTSSRNAASSFRGYHSFQRAHRSVVENLDRLLAGVTRTYMSRMGG